MTILIVLLLTIIITFFLFKLGKKKETEHVKLEKLSLNFDDSLTGFKHYMVFDTETDGLPIDFHGDPKDVSNWPRLVQLSWIILDSDFKMVSFNNHYIKTDFVINDKAIRIHGITNEYVQKNGSAIDEVLTNFVTDLESAEVLVAHNLEFGVPVIDAELLRLGMKRKLFRKRKMCTLKYGARLIGNYTKYPRLPFLFASIFGGVESDYKSHDAKKDVILVGKIFENLVENEIIKEEWIKPKSK